MVDVTAIRSAIVKGLRDYVGCPVIRSNQTGESPPYPYISYTITTLKTQNNGTYGHYEDDVIAKPTTQIWSITVQSDDNNECVDICLKAHTWLDELGRVYLGDNNVIVQSVGNVTNRDNMLTIEYEYRNGFDITIWCMDKAIKDTSEYIETVIFERSN